MEASGSRVQSREAEAFGDVGQMLQRVGFAPVVSLPVRNASSGFSLVPILSPILVRIPVMIH